MPSQQNQNPRLIAAQDLLIWFHSNQIRFQRRNSFINPSDFGLYRYLVSSVIRNRNQYLFFIEDLTGRKLNKIDPEAIICPMLGISQLEPHMKVQQYAAVNETVGLLPALNKGFLKGFVNANLRSFIRQEVRLRESCQQQALAVQTSHPDWMVTRWQKKYGDFAAEQICHFNNLIPKVHIAINPKFERQVVLEELKHNNVKDLEELQNGWRVNNPSGIFNTESLRSGAFLVQDPSSQQLIELIAPLPKQSVLDVCAAPGGKLFHLEWAYHSEIELLIAIDNSTSRMHRLIENKRRIGSKSRIAVMDAKKPAINALFDLVVVDAPCSGTGTIQKHPEIKWNRQPSDFLINQKNQLEILAGVRDLVKPGGFLLYVTCSLEVEENHEVVDQFLQQNSAGYSHVPWQTDGVMQDSFTKEGFYMCLPDQHRMGMFAALLQKK